MSRAFQYRPKFVDIRVRPPKPEEEDTQGDDVHALKPGEKPCEWQGCRRAATAKAPKSREMINEHYGFCQAHAAEYNRNWDFFAGMNEAQVRAHQEARHTGDRPTWAFKASKFSREAAAFAAKAGTGQGYSDPFEILSARARAARQQAEEDQRRRLGLLERKALAELDLEITADKAVIRARYTELVKRCHPDANGGDRSAEHRLARVIKAYKTLRSAGLA